MIIESGFKPLCFVLMPFGKKDDPSGGPLIDFDRVYHEALEPAITDAGLVAIRADVENTGGIIHKPMFERLLLCEYAIADLTTANANVFYELGVRHTARPKTTLTIFAKHQPIPFDLNYLRGLPYDLGKNNAFTVAEACVLREAVTKRLGELRGGVQEAAAVDSPIYQLLGDWKAAPFARDKTDVFRKQVQYSETVKRRLSLIRRKGKDPRQRQQALEDLAAVRQEFGGLDTDDRAVVIDLMLSYRALEDWEGVVALYEQMPEELKRQIMVREQLAFAINRYASALDNWAERETERELSLKILQDVEEQQGASSETCGLIGRINKDRWKEVLDVDPLLAGTHLDEAIGAYLRGYRVDPRDAYPGINAVTLLDIKGDEASLTEKIKLLPVVRFAVEQRLAGKDPDYWDYATMLELAVLEDDQAEALSYLGKALAAIRENWEPKSTANNLRMIKSARDKRGADTELLEKVIQRLEGKTPKG